LLQIDEADQPTRRLEMARTVTERSLLQAFLLDDTLLIDGFTAQDLDRACRKHNAKFEMNEFDAIPSGCCTPPMRRLRTDLNYFHALLTRERLRQRDRVAHNILAFTAHPTELHDQSATEDEDDPESSQPHPDARPPSRSTLAPTKQAVPLTGVLAMLSEREASLTEEVADLDGDVAQMKLDLQACVRADAGFPRSN
jgi:hypothetical protein